MCKQLLLLLLCSSTVLHGQISSPTKIEIKDEGTSQGRVGTVNFVGSPVTCTVSGDTATCTVSAGAANVADVTIDLGTSGGLTFSTTITGQAWVTTTSVILCNPFATATDGLTVETVAASGVKASAATRVAGTGFDLWIYSPHGATGTYRFHCTGA